MVNASMRTASVKEASAARTVRSAHAPLIRTARAMVLASTARASVTSCTLGKCVNCMAVLAIAAPMASAGMVYANARWDGLELHAANLRARKWMGAQVMGAVKAERLLEGTASVTMAGVAQRACLPVAWIAKMGYAILKRSSANAIWAGQVTTVMPRRVPTTVPSMVYVMKVHAHASEVTSAQIARNGSSAARAAVSTAGASSGSVNVRLVGQDRIVCTPLNSSKMSGRQHVHKNVTETEYVLTASVIVRQSGVAPTVPQGVASQPKRAQNLVVAEVCV